MAKKLFLTVLFLIMTGACLSAQDCGMVRIGTWSGYTIKDKSAFVSQLNNTANYGQNGTYNKVRGFTFTDITGTLSTLSVAQLVAQYDIINTGYSNMSSTDAQKIKQYVDAGGVALIFLDAGGAVGSNLHQVFGGSGTVGDESPQPSYGLSNTNAINNGIWGNASNVSLKGFASSGLVNISQLPSGAIQLANNDNTNTKARVWITGSGGKAIFCWDEGVFDPLDGYTISGTDINTLQEKFIHNLMVYALDKLKARTYTPTPTASAGGSTAICTGGSVTLTSSSATGNQWYKDGAIISGATGQTYVANAAGTYTVVVTSNGCVSSPSTGITVTVNPVPTAPTVSVTAASCSAAGKATVSNYNSAYTYTFSPSGPSVGAGGAISGMTAGTNYTVTAKNGSCTSAASTSFNIAAMLPTPAVPTMSTTSASCSAAGTATISNYNSAYTYTFSPSGPSVGAGGAISGMTAGTNYTVTAKNGSCTSAASTSFSIAAMLPTPAVPTVSTTSASCSAAGTATISNYNSAYTYTFSPSGPSVGAGGAISGMTAGTNYTVTAKNGSCTSAASTSFSIAAMLPTPAAPTVSTTSASCSAAGTATISNYNSAYTYTFSPSGPSVGAGGAISGMTAGTNYTVTAKNGSCTSAASTSFSIATMLPTPVAPTVSVITGTATISNYNSAYAYTFSPSGPSVGAGGAISGMIAGTSYTVTAKNGSCTSAASTSFSFLCTRPGDFSAAGVPTKFGITVQQKQPGWPENIPNGFITLESKTKGLVITRVQNQNAVTDPKEGMLIYDISAACVKLYNGTVWNCIQRSCNN